jgi:hypothetical protein
MKLPKPPNSRKNKSLCKGFTSILLALGLILSLSLSQQTKAQEPLDSLKDTVISIRSDDKWVGFMGPNKIFYAKLNPTQTCVQTFKETTLNDQEIVILERFLRIRKLFKDKKVNEATSKQQLEIVSGISLGQNQKTPQVDIKALIGKTTHISIWDQEEFDEVMLGTTKNAQENWPNNIASFLKLLYEPNSRASTKIVEGIGFTVPLDKPKEIGDRISWASTLRSFDYTFEKIDSDKLKTLPKNIQTFIEYSGFVVPLTTEDLKLMSSLNWPEYPEDVALKTELPVEPIIWWGLVEYKGKTYGINAWKSCKNP